MADLSVHLVFGRNRKGVAPEKTTAIVAETTTATQITTTETTAITEASTAETVAAPKSTQLETTVLSTASAAALTATRKPALTSVLAQPNTTSGTTALSWLVSIQLAKTTLLPPSTFFSSHAVAMTTSLDHAINITTSPPSSSTTDPHASTSNASSSTAAPQRSSKSVTCF